MVLIESDAHPQINSTSPAFPRMIIEMIIEQLRHSNDPANLIPSITFKVDSISEAVRRVFPSSQNSTT